MCVKIRIYIKPICIVAHYNPPGKIINPKIFEILESLKFEYLICSDLNSKTKLLGCHKTGRSGLELEKIILKFYCIVLNNEDFTYSKGSNYREILDLLIGSSSIANLSKDFKVLFDFELFSDHYPISISLNSKFTHSEANSVKSAQFRFDFSLANWDQFKIKLRELSRLSVKETVEDPSDFITNSLLEAAKSSIPSVKTTKVTALLVEIVLLIKKKKIARKLARKYKTDQFRKKYNELTKLVKESIQSFKCNQWNNFLDSLGPSVTSSRPFWSRINRLRGSNVNRSLPCLVQNEKEFSKDEEKANLFKDLLKGTFNEQSNSVSNNEFKEKIEMEVNEKMQQSDHNWNLCNETNIA